jgi:hypothetical protein
MLKAGNIKAEDLELLRLVDTAEEVVSLIDSFYKGHMLTPNF